MDPKKKMALKAILHELKGKRARHTELITVYVPAGFNLNLIISQLISERGTSENIKSATTRKNVQTALDKMVQHLRLYKSTPENGIAVFSGNVSEKEGGQDFHIWSVEPPEPMNMRFYRCDQTFYLEPLEKILEPKYAYGLIVIDRQEANIGSLRGAQVIEIIGEESHVPGKFRTGGQCCDPNCIVEEEKRGQIILSEVKKGDKLLSYNFNNKKLEYSLVTDVWKVQKSFSYNINTTRHSLIASADHLFFVYPNKEVPAEELKSGDKLLCKSNCLRISKKTKLNKSIKLIDISTTEGNFIANGLIVHNSAVRFARNREIMTQDFFKKIGDIANKEFANKPEVKGILIGGPGPTKDEFANGSYLSQDVKQKIIAVKDIGYTGLQGLHELANKSEDVLSKEELTLEKKAVEQFFEVLNKRPTHATYGKSSVEKALNLGAVDKLLISETINSKEAEEMMNKAEEFRGEWMVISNDTREGAQLVSLGGVGAILRFPIE